MTDAERFDLVCSIFEQIRDLESDEQELQLAELCGNDGDLLQQVKQMLGAHREPSPLDSPSQLLPIDALETAANLTAPEIERYEISDRLGEGGMGVVYAAEMRHPRRAVAIKVIKHGMDSARVIARFRHEQQTLARMEHPNIASVIDAGMTSDGRPFFAMELVRGEIVTSYASKNKLDIPARLEIAIMVCNAIQHAHQKGIIHRDIKPSNIIVTKSDEQVIPKVIDFGIAKATQQDLASSATMTMQAQAVGTPAYMSPEQADPSVGDVDTRTDVYSLGVVLYELLTGTTPLSKDELTSKSYPDIVESIREQDPPRPSTRLAISTRTGRTDLTSVIEPAQLKGDLDWVVMKCLEKDPSRRYETVSALGEDIGRFLRNEPVLARPASTLYLMRKFMRRNRGSVIAASIIIGSMLIGIVGTTLGLVWALDEQERSRLSAEAELRAQTRAKDAAELALREAQAAEDLSSFFIMDVLSAADPSRTEDRELTVREALVNASENLEGKFEDRPDVEGRIHNALGFLFGQLGDPQLAEKHHMREWEIAEEENGELSIDSARMMHSVVGSLARQGRDAEAIELTQRQLRIINQLQTQEAESLRPRVIGNLGALLVRTGRFEEAAPILEETLALKRGMYGDKHPTTLSTLNNLCSVYLSVGDAEQSIAYGREAYESRSEVLGEGDPRTFVSQLNLARALSDSERYDDALGMLSGGVLMARDRLGPEHPTTMDIVNAYARILLDSGDNINAESESRANLVYLLEADPELLQSRTISGHMTLATTLRNQSRAEDAAEITDTIVTMLNESERESYYLMSEILRLHGQILTSLDQFEQAEAALMQAWDLTADENVQRIDINNLRDAIIDLYQSWHNASGSEDTKSKLTHWSALSA